MSHIDTHPSKQVNLPTPVEACCWERNFDRFSHGCLVVCHHLFGLKLGILGFEVLQDLLVKGDFSRRHDDSEDGHGVAMVVPDDVEHLAIKEHQF